MRALGAATHLANTSKVAREAIDCGLIIGPDCREVTWLGEGPKCPEAKAFRADACILVVDLEAEFGPCRPLEGAWEGQEGAVAGGEVVVRW